MIQIKKIKAPIGDENRYTLKRILEIPDLIKKIKAPIGDENRVSFFHTFI